MVLAAPAPAPAAPLAAVELPDPVPAPGELVVDVHACAVCRTDLQLVEGDLTARRLPVVPGHQVVGRVASVGAAVSGWRPGDAAGAGWLAWACGTCRRCREGRENLCARAAFTGWDRDGGYAERVRVDAAFAARLPEALLDPAAAPLLCAGAIGHRALRLSGARPGDRLGLFGFGASATHVLLEARANGCEVFVSTRSAPDRARALAAGATWAGGPDDSVPVPLDAAVTFAPSGEVVLRALRALDRGGTVAVNAIHLDGIPAFPYGDLWWERTIRSVANVTRADVAGLLARALELGMRAPVRTYPLDGANAALADLAAGRVHGAAVLVPGPPPAGAAPGR